MNSIRPLGWSIFRLLAETACSGGYSPGRTERDDHVDDRTESVEVGVHRGLRADGVLGTVGFGLSALLSLGTADLVESII
jgi:hypothetical protein